ncbi:hypothetical protein [Brevundimonas sp.]|uniref:hypothetical protein n=1 Tax=Brevundimonas sp. TaxID=1871086 RepID=UPI002737D892|nr:hypothetical protein [Brevundimonas sp.]MDP3801129.1 hypothetical protein [Brevundimonas sp.]
MKAIFRAAAAATIIGLGASLGGCASLITGGELIRPGEPTGTIRVSNQSSGAVNVVLISDCNASTYGLNRLPSGYAIPRGGSYDFTVSAGCWDVAAGIVGYGDTRRRMQIAPGGGVDWTVTG